MSIPKTTLYPIDDFKSGESWRLFKIMGEFVEGIDALHDLGSSHSPHRETKLQPRATTPSIPSRIAAKVKIKMDKD